jgi:glycosyltransferase involved in cell wall biosynthesis
LQLEARRDSLASEPETSGHDAAKPLAQARVAIVFDWFQKFGGAERVVASLQRAFPESRLYALVHDEKDAENTPLEGVPVHTSFIQSLPKAREKYRAYLPLMPLAVENLDLRSYDIVISASHTVAKGVLTGTNQLHLSYTHTPVRYAWEFYLEYLSAAGLDRGLKSLPARLVLHYLRLWDVSASNRVDCYLANSNYVAQRIGKLYRRGAHVIHPPVDLDRYRGGALPKEEFFVTVSRFVPYKRLDLIVEAFTNMNKPLIVIGDGPERERLRGMAGPSVQFLGYQPDQIIVEHLQRARAFVFAADEDFGIAPVEAQAAGCPVIAYGRGGVHETVVGWPKPGATGIFFEAQKPAALEAAVSLFEAHEEDFALEACQFNAERFAEERFQRQIRATVGELWERFQRGESVG